MWWNSVNYDRLTLGGKGMEQRENNLLTINEFICSNVGGIVGISALFLPSSVVFQAKQDGWIATIIGGIYPLYVVLIAAIIIKKYPNTNIMKLSKQYLGKVLGNILNILFMLQFLYYVVGIIAAINDLLMIYSSWFMSPWEFTLVTVSVVVYGATRGIKTLGRINIITLIIMVFILLASSPAFIQGNIKNIQPVFGSGFRNMLNGTITTFFAYGLMEGILVIHPYVKQKEKIIKAGLISTALAMIFYTWIVFTSTIYMGSDIIIKSIWSYAFVSESIKIPIINNFRFIWAILWPIPVFRTIITEYYMSTEVANEILNIGCKKWCVILLPVILIFPMIFENEVARREFFATVTPCVTIFNLSYVTLIAILVFVKKKSNSLQ
jgi:spore germination protein